MSAVEAGPDMRYRENEQTVAGNQLEDTANLRDPNATELLPQASSLSRAGLKVRLSLEGNLGAGGYPWHGLEMPHLCAALAEKGRCCDCCWS
jgi:hypothetical protein